eukprot:scaffold28.g7574.t1
MEAALLKAIDEAGEVASDAFAEQQREDHNAVVGVIKSLLAHEMIEAEDVENSRFKLTEEAESYLAAGSPEVQVFTAVGPDGITLAALKARGGRAGEKRQSKQLGPAGDVGFKQAMQLKWVAIDKSGGEPRVARKVEAVTDRCQALLAALAASGAAPADASEAEVVQLRKRKLLVLQTWKTYRLRRGPKFALERRKAATDLTAEMLQNSLPASRLSLYVGAPLFRSCSLLQVRSQFRKIFTQMGFEEMPTNNYVESSFWNFDALFQPQQHPARDAHDTFFLTKPAATPASTVPADYLARVKATHESGGYGSQGYGYAWKTAEAEKNLLRTHTTAVSSRMLYRLAQEGFRPAKYFSVDRVFRNEAIDRTHLAEFHQIEGVVCDVGLTLGDLIGTLQQFFDRLGLHQLRFKPAYNPYTEPSMEIFSYSQELGKWMEVGNSGMFRPEMLRPMGLPEGVNVIAWGLSLERPTMILYNIDNIRDLFGHKVSLSMVKRNPICRLGL